MTRKPVIIMLTAALLKSVAAWGQSLPKFKFGEPTMEELKMTTYDKDSSAAAVVLLNLRDVGFRLDGGDITEVTTNRFRIKILKDAGKDYANVDHVLYNSQGAKGHEKIFGIKAVAVNLENGKVVKTKMKSDMIFTEKIDEYHDRVKFTIPQAKVGSVIEYEYNVSSDLYYQMDDWNVQQPIPVVHARYTSIIPEWLLFRYELRGPGLLQPILGDGLVERRDVIQTTSKNYVYVGNNMPAAKGDDYVWCKRDYIARITAELTATNFPYVGYKDFGETWDRIDEMLHKADWFGSKFGSKSPYCDEIKEKGIDKIADTEQRAVAVLKLLFSHLKWNETFELSPQSMTKTAKAGTGSNADINLIMVNMLRDAGIEAVPVVMRLRNTGTLPVTYPSMDKLNTFVVGIPTGEGKMMYADASSEKGFLNAFTPSLYVNKARILSKGEGEKWVDLQLIGKANESNVVTAAIDANGELKGKVKAVHRGTGAYMFRSHYAQAKDEKEYVTDKEEDYNISIADYKTTDAKEFGDEASEDYTFTRKGEATDDHIYISPIIYPMVKSNPFTDATRQMPIEFPFIHTERTLYTITIPEGWEVEELPKSVNIATQGREMTARIVCGVDNNVIKCNTIFKINKVFFANNRYDEVKTFFANIVERSKDLIVLKKKP